MAKEKTIPYRDRVGSSTDLFYQDFVVDNFDEQAEEAIMISSDADFLPNLRKLLAGHLAQFAKRKRDNHIK